VIGKKIWGTNIGLSGSEFQRIFDKDLSGDISIDLNFEKLLQENIRKLIANNLIVSAHDISVGGFMTAMILCCEQNKLGAKIDRNIPENWAGALFGEDQSRIIFSYEEKYKREISRTLSDVNWHEIGTVIDKNIKFENILLESDSLFLSYNKGFSSDI